jgi:hypothetical protein
MSPYPESGPAVTPGFATPVYAALTGNFAPLGGVAKPATEANPSSRSAVSVGWNGVDRQRSKVKGYFTKR